MNASTPSTAPTTEGSSFGRVWLITWLAIAALLVGKSIWWSGDETQQVASAASTVDVSLNQPGLGLPQTRTVHEFKAIEDLRVGDRVVSDNPDTPSSLKLGPEQTAVDPATWRKVTLYAEETWPDGTLDTIHIETLQPPLWLELYEAKVGSQVPPPLDLVEMGLPADLMTTVVAIESCPKLEAGNGRVVLTTVNHLNNDVWQLTAVNQSGRREQLKPTGFHKFYSETRHDWVSTKDIHDREVIRGRAGPLTIVDAKKLLGTQRVYNLTVESEHVYYVSELGLLAHNTRCGPEEIRFGINLRDTDTFHDRGITARDLRNIPEQDSTSGRQFIAGVEEALKNPIVGNVVFELDSLNLARASRQFSDLPELGVNTTAQELKSLLNLSSTIRARGAKITYKYQGGSFHNFVDAIEQGGISRSLTQREIDTLFLELR